MTISLPPGRLRAARRRFARPAAPLVPLATTCLCTAGLLLLTSCERYQAAPIDVAAEHQAWLERDSTALNASVLDAESLHPSTDAERPAPSFNLADGISLAEAEVLALFANPHLRVTRSLAGLADARIDAADAWRDPGLQINAERILADVDEPWVFGGGLAITLPLSGQPGVRQAVAEARLAVADAEVIGAEWALLNQLRQAWIELQRRSLTHAQLAQQSARLQQLQATAKRLLSANQLEPHLMAEIAFHDRRHQVLVANAQQAIAQQRLLVLSLLGVHPALPWHLEPSWPQQLHSLPSRLDHELSAAFHAVEQHPQLAITMAAYDVAERSLQLEIRKQYPDLTIGFGASNEDGHTRLQLGLGLLPIPVWNRNRAGIAEATVDRASSGAQLIASMQDLVHRLAQQQAHLRAKQAHRNNLHNALLPQARQHEQTVRVELANGHASLLDVFAAMDARFHVELDLINAAAAAASAASHVLANFGQTAPSGAQADDPHNRTRVNQGSLTIATPSTGAQP